MHKLQRACVRGQSCIDLGKALGGMKRRQICHMLCMCMCLCNCDTGSGQVAAELPPMIGLSVLLERRHRNADSTCMLGVALDQLARPAAASHSILCTVLVLFCNVAT